MIKGTSSAAGVPSRRRVLFLNDVGFQYGAGIAQARQVQSMLEWGWEVGALAWEPADIFLERIITRPVDADLWLGMQRVRHLEHEAGLSDEDIIAGLLLEVARFSPDVIVAGNLHCPKWPLQLLSALANIGIRVIAYLHDGYLFTGRCPYPDSCNLYLTGCNETCPTADEYPPLKPDLIAGQWSLRRQIFNGANGVEVVTNSHWTRDMFRSALPACRSCETVYLGADEGVFRLGDTELARKNLNLPLDKPIVLCAAVNFHERRKGAIYLSEVISKLKESVVFAAFGHNTDQIPGLIGLGYHTDPSKLAEIYRAADIFLGTSTQEAFGQTILEAQLSGLPVVAFQVGGLPEIVRGEITGKLVRSGDSAGLIAAIESLLAEPHFLKSAGQWASYSAAKRFSLGSQARAWDAYLSGRKTVGTGFSPPEFIYPRGATDEDLPHRPSWPAHGTFVNAAHERIFEQTSHLPGWQMRGDSLKLYELGYHAGDVILEIGTFGGRSATVALRGALANPERTVEPQFYGIDILPESIARTRQILADQDLIHYSHLFKGNLTEFTQRWSIIPTMVFLDGDHRYAGVAADLAILSRYLKSGTPVLVHDFLNPENEKGEVGVKQAALEWEASGKARLIGCFGCSALYLTQPDAAVI